jgi:ribonuclease BN (tRNA processing enzyme)
MFVTILGSGTSIPSLDRGPPGVLVESDGLSLLVDLGPGILRRLPAAGLDPGDIDVVLLTHFHTDHAADLAPLLFALKSPRYEGRGPLRILGPAGLRDLHAALEDAWGAWIRPTTFPWDLEEVGPDETVDLGRGVTARTVSVEHTPVSLAYRLTDAAGAVAAISGDTGICPGAVEAGRDADLYVLECAFPDRPDEEEPWHLSPSRAGSIATEAGCGRLCLTHFYPECDAVDVVGQCRATFDGPLSPARDGLRFEVLPGDAREAAP